LYKGNCVAFALINIRNTITQVQSPCSTSWRKFLNCFMTCDEEKEIEKWYNIGIKEKKKKK